MLLFIDGFDHYNNDNTAKKKWDDPIATSGYVTGGSNGRFGTGGANPGGSSNLFYHQWVGMQKTFQWTPTPPTELIIGFSAKFDFIDGQHPFLQIIANNGKPQVQLWLDGTSGEIIVTLADPSTEAIPTGTLPFPAPTVIGNTGYIPPIGLWFFLEVKVSFSTGAGGSVDIQIDSNPLVSYTGIKTANSMSGTVTNFKGWRISGLQQFISGWTIDDVYMADNFTGEVMDFTGEVRIQTMYPDAEGFQNDFLPSVGSNNATNVDLVRTSWIEAGNPAEYNFAGHPNDIDLYSIGNFTVAGTIFGVQANLSHRKDDVGPRRIAPITRVGGNIYVGIDVPEYSDYTWAGSIWEVNPFLASAWTLTDLNQAEFGIKIIS